jgi:hypothetical protein
MHITGAFLVLIKETEEMKSEKLEHIDVRSITKMKRAKKFEKRIKSKKMEKDYKTLSK